MLYPGCLIFPIVFSILGNDKVPMLALKILPNIYRGTNLHIPSITDL